MDYHSIFLFQGLTEADIDQMERSRCLRRKAFARRQTIFRTGDTVHEIGIVLRGLCLVVYLAVLLVIIVLRIRMMFFAYQGIRFTLPVVGEQVSRWMGV